MSGDKRAAWNRKAFKRHRSLSSEKEGCASGMGTLNNIRESSSPKPCPGSSSSSSCFLVQNELMDTLKDLQRDVAKQMSNMQNMFLSEIKNIESIITDNSRRFESGPEKCTRYVQTVYSYIGETERQNLLQENPECKHEHADCGQVNLQKVPSHGTAIKTFESTEQNTEVKTPYSESDSERNRKKHNGYDNVIITGKRSYSLHTRVNIVAACERPRSTIPLQRATFEERDCLANALQFHVEDLIDGVVFHESELPDLLLAEDCLTEDECASVRKLNNRKDQIRFLLSLIKGRDLRVLKGFLKHIEDQNPSVAERINKTFENNKKNGVKRKACALCMMIEDLDVKQVADSLWSLQVINTKLYQRIVRSDGSQSELWKEVIYSLKVLDHRTVEIAQKKLIRAICRKNLYTHLAESVKDMLVKNHGIFVCNCEQKLCLPRRTSFGDTTSGESLLPASFSDSASNDMTSSDGTDNGTMQGKRITNAEDEMPSIKEVLEDPPSPSRTEPEEVTAIKHRGNDIVSSCPEMNKPNLKLKQECKTKLDNKTAVSMKKKDILKPPVTGLKPPVPPKRPENAKTY